VGGQRFPVHWGGDCESTYAPLAESLRGGLSLGLGGFASWSHDIGGFEGTPPAGPFNRWVAFGLLSSHSRLHGSSSHGTGLEGFLAIAGEIGARVAELHQPWRAGMDLAALAGDHRAHLHRYQGGRGEPHEGHGDRLGAARTQLQRDRAGIPR
jgi:hypothetical protein